MDIEMYLFENRFCYDRFSFDRIFRFLLLSDYTHEEAKELILFHCCLSAIIFQERLDNDFYKTISINDKTSTDLQKMQDDTFIEKYVHQFRN